MSRSPDSRSKLIAIVLYDGLEALDVFGPVQMWGRLPAHALTFVSADGGPRRSSQGAVVVANHSFETVPQCDVLMVPGGEGARQQVDDPALLSFICRQDGRTRWTASV